MWYSTLNGFIGGAACLSTDHCLQPGMRCTCVAARIFVKGRGCMNDIQNPPNSTSFSRAFDT
eukprot:6189969-Pleurochrysis_carterae.AAC.2